MRPLAKHYSRAKRASITFFTASSGVMGDKREEERKERKERKNGRGARSAKARSAELRPCRFFFLFFPSSLLLFYPPLPLRRP